MREVTELIRKLLDEAQRLKAQYPTEELGEHTPKDYLIIKYHAYVANQIEAICQLEKKPEHILEQLNSFLVEHWERVKGTAFAYTAMPDSGSTRLLVSVAEAVADVKKDKAAIEYLIPNVVEPMYDDANKFPHLGYPDGYSVGHTPPDALKILQRSVLSLSGDNEVALIPVNLLTDADVHEDRYLSPYYDNWSNWELKSDIFEKLGEHSLLARNLVEARKRLVELREEAQDGYSVLSRLIKKISRGDAHTGGGTQEDLGALGYSGLPDLFEFIEKNKTNLPKEMIDRVGTYKKAFGAHQVNLQNAQSGETVQRDVALCVGSLMDDLRELKEAHKDELEALSLGEERDAKIADAEKEVIICESSLRKAVEDNTYSGQEVLPISLEQLRIMEIELEEGYLENISCDVLLSFLVDLTPEDIEGFARDKAFRGKLLEDYSKYKKYLVQHARVNPTMIDYVLADTLLAHIITFSTEKLDALLKHAMSDYLDIVNINEEILFRIINCVETDKAKVFVKHFFAEKGETVLRDIYRVGYQLDRIGREPGGEEDLKKALSVLNEFLLKTIKGNPKNLYYLIGCFKTHNNRYLFIKHFKDHLPKFLTETPDLYCMLEFYRGNPEGQKIILEAANAYDIKGKIKDIKQLHSLIKYLDKEAIEFLIKMVGVEYTLKKISEIHSKEQLMDFLAIDNVEVKAATLDLLNKNYLDFVGNIYDLQALVKVIPADKCKEVFTPTRLKEIIEYASHMTALLEIDGLEKQMVFDCILEKIKDISIPSTELVKIMALLDSGQKDTLWDKLKCWDKLGDLVPHYNTVSWGHQPDCAKNIIKVLKTLDKQKQQEFIDVINKKGFKLTDYVTAGKAEAFCQILNCLHIDHIDQFLSEINNKMAKEIFEYEGPRSLNSETAPKLVDHLLKLGVIAEVNIRKGNLIHLLNNIQDPQAKIALLDGLKGKLPNISNYSPTSASVTKSGSFPLNKSFSA